MSADPRVHQALQRHIRGEVIASGCWLGHLLGLTMRAVELADDETERPGLVARTHLAQGTAAALPPLGTVPILVASGLICLAATGIIVAEQSPIRRAQPAHVWGRWLESRERTGGERRLALRGLLPRDRATIQHIPPAHPAMGLDAASERRVRTRLPLALKRVLAADCPSCRGLGCRSCYGSGLS